MLDERVLSGIIVGITIGYLLFGINAKYDGMTAKEWFNMYDAADENYINCKTAVEDYLLSK